MKTQREQIEDRIKWLKQKLAMQRDPTNADCTLDKPLLTGRTEGNIGSLEWVLREVMGVKP